MATALCRSHHIVAKALTATAEGAARRAAHGGLAGAAEHHRLPLVALVAAPPHLAMAAGGDGVGGQVAVAGRPLAGQQRVLRRQAAPALLSGSRSRMKMSTQRWFSFSP